MTNTLDKMILTYLRKRHGKLVSANIIWERMLNKDPDVTKNMVNKALSRLRKEELIGVGDVLSSDGYTAYRSAFTFSLEVNRE